MYVFQKFYRSDVNPNPLRETVTPFEFIPSLTFNCVRMPLDFAPNHQENDAPGRNHCHCNPFGLQNSNIVL